MDENQVLLWTVIVTIVIFTVAGMFLSSISAKAARKKARNNARQELRWKVRTKKHRVTVSHVDCGIIFTAKPISDTDNSVGIPLSVYVGEIPQPKDILLVALDRNNFVVGARMYKRGAGHLNQGCI